MAQPMSTLSPEEMNAGSQSMLDDDFDLTFHDPPSSPFVEHIEIEDQENVAPGTCISTKSLSAFDDPSPQSAFKLSPEKKVGLREQTSPKKTSPVKNLMGDFQDAARRSPFDDTNAAGKRPQSATNSSPRKSRSPSKSPHASLIELTPRGSDDQDPAPDLFTRSSSPLAEPALRENEGLTVALKVMEETRSVSEESATRYNSHDEAFDTAFEEHMDHGPDGPDFTSGDIDDTSFSMFSEMPGIDMTKFAFLNKNSQMTDHLNATPRARAQMTPSTVRRSERTPSPTPRRSYKENDTTSLLLDFTEQIQSFSQSRRVSPARGRPSPSKSVTQPDLRSYYQNQRSPAKGVTTVTSTPSHSRQMLNLLDFELPPPPTPRSLPTVTIRELESVKSQFQSQISSLSASLSGKEAEVESLAKAIGDAERRVGEAQETVRDERSAREYAESQMEDWKKKGEEVQKLLQDVQSELAHNDSEREQLLVRLAEAEKRAEEADNRASDLETKVIEAESRNVDMTTFINNDDGQENKKIYSELECQSAIAEKVNEVARDLHTAYKAKHEKKIKALKENYQKKADERCKDLRLQIIRLERQVEEAEKKRDDTFSKVVPPVLNGDKSQLGTTTSAEDAQQLESQRSEIESLKAKLAGLQSELKSLRKSHDKLVEDLEAERVEKGELVAAAEQMLSLCGEKMEELQQEDFRRSTTSKAQASAQKPKAAPEHAMRNTGFLAGGSSASRPGSALANSRPAGSGIAKPSGIRGPAGGFGFQGGSSLNQSTGSGKSRLLSNIERMGGGRTHE